jgi:toxin ParE1/3/4
VTRPNLRPQAEADLVERSRYYRNEGGSDLGERFFDAAKNALNAIGRMPGTGSPRVGEVCGIDGLRVRRIPNFPCGWFYFASGDRVDVVRLLADAQDITVVFAEMEQD